MKILITGTRGYIAKSFADQTKETDFISLRDDTWQDASFAGYDTVLHTAGLAHLRETRRNQHDYYAINRDLTLAVATKAKKDGVRQFIFLSSISVYGLTTGVITAHTPTAPTTHYGQSKLEAESLLASLADDTFSIAILRPPMVYGPGCPGNYRRLQSLVKIAPFFPDYPNARSVVHIHTLCASIQKIIERRQGGLFFPRDIRPVSTPKLAIDIADTYGKNLTLTKAFNGLITRLMPLSIIAKLFGSLTIEISDENA